MKISDPSKVNAYFQTDNGLKSLFAKVRELQDLQGHLSKYIEPNLIKSLQVANRLGDKLVVIALNGSVATQVRLLTADLLVKFKQDPCLKFIRSIECKVRPSVTRQTASSEREIKSFSSETGEIIRSIAESISDPKLRGIMQKIAEHGKGKGLK